MQYPMSKEFAVSFEDLQTVADGLNRPECLLALDNGTLIAAHGGAGYSVISGQGKVEHVLIKSHAERTFLPNGIALAETGEIMFADLGKDEGGLFAISHNGEVKPVLTLLNGQPLPPSNYLVNDADGRLWFTVSTRLKPRTAAWNHRVADGYIGVIDTLGARIVADGIGYTNEIAFSPCGQWMYVNETYNQKTSRFPLYNGGRLGPKEVVIQFDGADFPDGLTFDECGGLWITCIGSNRLLVLRPDDGSLQVILEDTDQDYVRRLAAKVLEGTLGAVDMSTAGRSRLGNISSLAFGGPDRKTAYLGCLLNRSVKAFTSPVAGLAPIHWKRRINTGC
ncbi:SMP-30/gluconolactonase/LRE family protein [Pseudomonas caspiana]|uniref:Gluconolaconase n=1 Tax=Pseudomonas caspiana TaxID=1451454 RepID=A0A1Y3P7X1_9PSED|nr:SMP-30/gluconolactonase/LRE family protein [Pseudomonas caspiana]OUM75839.1 gluconolaconase [Pseudomonas caspiana]